jgi:predicted metal-dependent peptidase
MMIAKDKIVKAKVKLQKENPFFAYLVANLRFQENKNIETIGVNFKGDCFYNPKFVEELSDNHLRGVLAHEVMHLVLEHLLRNGNKDKMIFNIACDLAINNILVNNSVALPDSEGCLIPYNNRFQFPQGVWIEDLDKKTAEEIYDEIISNKKLVDEKNISICDKGRFDEHEYSQDGKESKEFKEVKEQWNKASSEASVYAKQQGKLPKGVEKILEAVLNEKVNWKYLLYKYLTKTLPYDYTYSRPSKKSISSGFYMPSILKENIEVVVSIDTSGSISQEELREFLGEIISLIRSFNNIKIKIIICDAEIKEVYDIGNGDIDKVNNLKISGGGGTSHIPIYDYIDNKLPNTKLVVHFTDGYTEFPDTERVKSVWILTKDSCRDDYIPFGDIIRLE